MKATDDFIAHAVALHHANKHQNSTFSELNNYLHSRTTDDLDIISLWHRYERHAPGLAQIAKDILAVQTAGVGVERRFLLHVMCAPITETDLTPRPYSST